MPHTPVPRTVSPSKLSHIVLRTRDNYQAMVEWYQTVLNAENVGDFAMGYGAMTLLTYDDEHHRVAILQMPNLADAAPHPSAGVDHIAFTFADVSDLLHTSARLKAAGIEPTVAMNHGATTSIYYLDPDDNRIELLVDNVATKAEAIQFVHDTFDINPLGTVFNPEEAYAALLAGADPSSLSRCLNKDEVRPPEPALLALLTD